jgi:hypothetical protein
LLLLLADGGQSTSTENLVKPSSTIEIKSQGFEKKREKATNDHNNAFWSDYGFAWPVCSTRLDYTVLPDPSPAREKILICMSTRLPIFVIRSSSFEAAFDFPDGKSPSLL